MVGNGHIILSRLSHGSLAPSSSAANYIVAISKFISNDRQNVVLCVRVFTGSALCDITLRFMCQVHVIIQEIFLNGAVHKDGRLFPGDQVVAVRRYPVPRLYKAFKYCLCTNLIESFIHSCVTFMRTIFLWRDLSQT